MSNYFDLSQQVRKEIEQNPQLMDVLRKIAEQDGDTLEQTFVGAGNYNRHYRIGMLDSGLWVVVREYMGGDISTILDRKHTLNTYETYATMAGDYYEIRIRASKFCVGVLAEDIDYAALLVEDFTEGGKFKLMDLEGSLVMFREKDGKDENIAGDLDNTLLTFPDGYRYMNKDACILLNFKSPSQLPANPVLP